MAIVRIPEENRVFDDTRDIANFLAKIGIAYERWETPTSEALDAPAEEMLATYGEQIDRLKAQGGYVTADVIDVNSNTPGLEAMLVRFNVEHWHDEDEVRYILAGRGLFHIHPPEQPVVVIEVEAGDLIRVPRGTRHWFDLCSEKRIRAIRLFQDVSGWTPHYTHSEVERAYAPVCFGPRYIPRQQITK